MNVASRGIRNAFRNKIRTFSIVIILGLSIGLALAMLIARQAVQEKIDTVKSSIGNTVSISPAGVRGFEGGGEPLTTDQIAKVSKLANITKVTQVLNERLTSDNTNLQSSIEPGTLGKRRANDSGVGFQTAPDMVVRHEVGGSAGPEVTRTFTPPVMLIGTNDTSSASVFGGNSITFTSGGSVDPAKDEDKAIVGKSLAEKNSLKVGSTFTAYGKTITVAGIYDTGNMFGNGGLVMSLPTLQRLSGLTGQITSATATINSIDNIDGAVTAIKSSLGDKADVVSNQDTAKNAIAPLENVKTISLYSLVGAIIAGAVIILLTMIMIVRERRREIGVMKAIGASNFTTTLQFVSEAVTLTILGMVVGLVIGVTAANPITKVLVTTNSSNSSAQSVEGPRQGGPGIIRSFSDNGIASVRNIKTDVGLDIIAYGMGAAIVIAIIGSALPAYLISKVRPAEVMRAE
jgi:putative ABC transport system permease protein